MTPEQRKILKEIGLPNDALEELQAIQRQKWDSGLAMGLPESYLIAAWGDKPDLSTEREQTEKELSRLVKVV